MLVVTLPVHGMRPQGEPTTTASCLPRMQAVLAVGSEVQDGLELQQQQRDLYLEQLLSKRRGRALGLTAAGPSALGAAQQGEAGLEGGAPLQVFSRKLAAGAAAAGGRAVAQACGGEDRESREDCDYYWTESDD
jgi:hypothetical protein